MPLVTISRVCTDLEAMIMLVKYLCIVYTMCQHFFECLIYIYNMQLFYHVNFIRYSYFPVFLMIKLRHIEINKSSKVTQLISGKEKFREQAICF